MQLGECRGSVTLSHLQVNAQGFAAFTATRRLTNTYVECGAQACDPKIESCALF
jgi:hypothetical protein